MYNPKYDVPLAVGLSLAFSLIATYVATGNTLNPVRIVDGALASALEVPKIINTAATDNVTWLDEPGMVCHVAGEFTGNLPHILEDENRPLFDQFISKARVTDTRQACEVAARPDTHPANHDIACSACFCPRTS